MASIRFDEPNGRWKATIRKIGHKTLVKRFDTKRDAQAWVTQVESEMVSGKNQHQNTEDLNKKYRVRDIFSKYLTEVISEQRDQEEGLNRRPMRIRLRRAIENAKWMNKLMASLGPEDIDAYKRQRLSDGVTKATINRELSDISSVFNHAYKIWKIGHAINPVKAASRFTGPGVDQRREERWSDADIEAMKKLAGWSEDYVPPVKRHGSMEQFAVWAMMVAIETSCRLGEIVNIQPRDFFPERDYVLLRQTKNGEAFKKPISKRAAELIQKLIDGQNLQAEDKLFPYTSESIGASFRSLRNKAGLTHLRFHDTRHEAISRIAKKVPNVAVLAGIIGHKDAKHLFRYVNLTPSEHAAYLN
jgi:integrase